METYVATYNNRWIEIQSESPNQMPCNTWCDVCDVIQMNYKTILWYLARILRFYSYFDVNERDHSAPIHFRSTWLTETGSYQLHDL